MISSLRAFGYDLSMAIANLFDNDNYASGNRINVDYGWDADKS